MGGAGGMSGLGIAPRGARPAGTARWGPPRGEGGGRCTNRARRTLLSIPWVWCSCMRLLPPRPPQAAAGLGARVGWGGLGARVWGEGGVLGRRVLRVDVRLIVIRPGAMCRGGAALWWGRGVCRSTGMGMGRCTGSVRPLPGEVAAGMRVVGGGVCVCGGWSRPAPYPVLCVPVGPLPSCLPASLHPFRSPPFREVPRSARPPYLP